MVYYFIKVFIYIISICLSMYGLSSINFEQYLKKYKVRQFYVLFLILSISLGYLFASFIIDFTNLSLGGY